MFKKDITFLGVFAYEQKSGISLYSMQLIYCEADIGYATNQFIHYICAHKLITMAVCCTNSSTLANEDELCSFWP